MLIVFSLHIEIMIVIALANETNPIRYCCTHSNGNVHWHLWATSALNQHMKHKSTIIISIFSAFPDLSIFYMHIFFNCHIGGYLQYLLIIDIARVLQLEEKVQLLLIVHYVARYNLDMQWCQWTAF